MKDIKWKLLQISDLLYDFSYIGNRAKRWFFYKTARLIDSFILHCFIN